jgi:hypothetical protein
MAFLDDQALKAIPPKESLPVVLVVVILGESLFDILDQLRQRGPALAVVLDVIGRNEPVLSVVFLVASFYLLIRNLYFRIDTPDEMHVNDNDIEEHQSIKYSADSLPVL